MMMTHPRVLLALLLLPAGICLSELTTGSTQDGVTFATSGNDSPTSLSQVSSTETTQMTVKFESNTLMTTDDAPKTSYETISTTGQPITTAGTMVVPYNSVMKTNDGFMTTAELTNTITTEDNEISRITHSTTVATAVVESNTATGNNGITTGAATTVISQSISSTTGSLATEASALRVSGSAENTTGSGSVTWTTSDFYVTTNNYTTPQYTESSKRSASDATNLQSTIHVTGSIKYDNVTTSDEAFSDVTEFRITYSDVTASDVTLTLQSHSSASPASHVGSQYTKSDIIIIVVVTVVGGLIIISALVIVTWKLRLYRNLPRYFRSNGNAQEFNMATSNSADGKQPQQADPEIGVLSDDDYQPPEPNFALELIPESDLHEQALFSKADTLAAGFQTVPAAMVDVPLNDAVGARNEGFQGDNATVF